jgi:hypothetical protein
MQILCSAFLDVIDNKRVFQAINHPQYIAAKCNFKNVILGKYDFLLLLLFSVYSATTLYLR